MVKISELRQTEVRTRFNYIGADNQEHEIIIYNPIPEAREKILEIVANNIDDESEMLVDENEMMKTVFPLLSNIEIDVENIEDILANPTKELLMAHAEIQTIVNELAMEVQLAKRLELEKLLLMLEQIKGMNMVEYINKKAEAFKPLKDFDPLNSDAKEARDRIELNEAKSSLEYVKEFYKRLKEEEKVEEEVDK